MSEIYYRLPDLNEEDDFKAPEMVQEAGTLEAEWCAEDFFDNCDGWEADWPQIIALHDGSGGPEIGRYRVELEARPEFHAREIDEQEPDQ